MALIYGLWAECKTEVELLHLKEHFSNLEYTLSSKRTIRFIANIEEDHDINIRGLNLWSPGICVNGSGIETLQDALDTNETGIFLYHCLRNAPNFRFAHVGWNAELQSKSSDLPDWVEVLSDGRNHWQGFECIINDELYKELGLPIPFWQFREGFWWQKFRGEEYNPLFSSDQNELRGVCKKLLPDNFDWSKSVRE